MYCKIILQRVGNSALPPSIFSLAASSNKVTYKLCESRCIVVSDEVIQHGSVLLASDAKLHSSLTKSPSD